MKYFLTLIAVVGTTLLTLQEIPLGGVDSILPTVRGAINPVVTQANIQDTICKSGWTATIRPPSTYTTALKKKQLPPNAVLSDYEEDHAISLELGGHPTDPNNLWPESYKTTPNAHNKDSVENLLKKEVCDGTITLAEAQKEVMNWVAVWNTLHSKLGGTGTITESTTDD